jgi:hypothetical protein
VGVASFVAGNVLENSTSGCFDISQNRHEILDWRAVCRIVAVVCQPHLSIPIDDEVAAQLIRIGSESGDRLAPAESLVVEPKIAWVPGAEEGPFKFISTID